MPAKAIVKLVATPLASGDILTGLLWCYYDGTNFRVNLTTGGGGGGTPFADNTAFLKNNSDATKLLKFDLSAFTTATTNTLTPPNFSGTIATLAGTETFSNKTFVSPALGSPASGNFSIGTFTWPVFSSGNLPTGIVIKDVNSNIQVNNTFEGGASTVTAAATTTLTAASQAQQYFTGSTTQTVLLPVVSGIPLYMHYYFTNLSSGTVTVQSSGANTVQAMGANSYLVVTCISNSGTTAASWSANYQSNISGGGGGMTALTGDVTASGSGSVSTTLATVNSNVGSFGSSTQSPTFTVNGKGLITAASNVTITPAIGSVTGLASGVAAWAATPSSANLAAAMTDETGSGSVVFSTNASLVTPTTLGVQQQALNMNSHQINNVTDPTSAQDATTKNYVDNAVLGQRAKEAVKYTSTTALPSIVYSNGSSGVGATLTGVALAAISLDGSTPSVSDRVLIKDQATTFQNGIYIVTQVGSGAAIFILTRAIDFDEAADIQTGDIVYTTAGSANIATTWTYNGVDSPTMGTTAITFAQTGFNFYSSENIGDADHTWGTGKQSNVLTVALTTNRVLTLPAANSFQAGTILQFVDQIGGVSSTATMAITPAGADKINNVAAPFTIYTSGTVFRIRSDGSSNWTGGIASSPSDGTFTNWTPSFTGFSANPTSVTARYFLTGKMCTTYVSLTNGTSTGAASVFTITLPFAAANTAIQLDLCQVTDNGTRAVGRILTTANSNILTVYPSMTGTASAWQTGVKGCGFVFTYETN